MDLSEKEIQRFWSKVDKITPTEKGCWVWLPTKNSGTYGDFWSTILRRHLGAHRFSLYLEFGSSALEYRVLHRCDNPPCVNPKHLFLGTAKMNMDDMSAKGRAKWCYSKIKGKLSRAQRDEIRNILRVGNVPHTIIAEDYGVSVGEVVKLSRELKQGYIY